MKRITVPEEGIETLFGSYDENLKHLESLFDVRIRTQGHDLLVDGDSPGVRERRSHRRSAVLADARRLQAVERRRQDRRRSGRAGQAVDLREHFLKGSLTPAGKRRVAPKTINQRRYLDAIERQRHRLRHRSGRHRQDLSGDGAGGRVPGREEGEPHHPGAAGGRGGREARVPARRPAGEGQSVPAAALRRAVRHARRRARRPLPRARHDRDRADRVHARPDAERLVRHPRRGAEHDVGADEDVPDAPRLRVEGGDHRRHHADRSAARPHVRAGSRR